MSSALTFMLVLVLVAGGCDAPRGDPSEPDGDVIDGDVDGQDGAPERDADVGEDADTRADADTDEDADIHEDAGCHRTCETRECGWDGCGGSCGECGIYEDCVSESWCEAPATPDGAPPLRVLTYNACGNVCSYEGVTASDWADSLANAISHWSADAILFTELCYGQLTALRSHLGDGWGYAWLASHAAPSGCAKWGSDMRFGMAILARHDSVELPERRTATLSSTADCGDSNPRQMLCATPVVDGESTLTCVTHLTTGTVDCRSGQAREVADLTLAWSGGGATIVAGDLNAEPADPELSSLYEVDGSGRFLEADQEDSEWWPSGCSGACRSGEPTFRAATPTKKLDYILFSSAHFDSVTGDGAHSDGSMSDHRLFRGAARRR